MIVVRNLHVLVYRAPFVKGDRNQQIVLFVFFQPMMLDRTVSTNVSFSNQCFFFQPTCLYEKIAVRHQSEGPKQFGRQALIWKHRLNKSCDKRGALFLHVYVYSHRVVPDRAPTRNIGQFNIVRNLICLHCAPKSAPPCFKKRWISCPASPQQTFQQL